MQELDKTGLEAVSAEWRTIPKDILEEIISAYLSSTSAGVTEEQTPRVRPLPQMGEEAERYRQVRGPEWTAVFDTLRDYRMSNMCWEDGLSAYPLVDRLSREGDGVSIADGEWEMVNIADEIMSALEASRVAPVSQKEAVPVAFQWRMRVAIGDGWGEWCDWREGKKWVTTHEGEAEYEERPLYASPAPAVEPVGIKADDRLYNADEPMADGEVEMTAAENVLGWLIIEKIGVPDDRNYSPNEAQAILSHRLDAATEMETALVTLSFADYRGADHSASAPASVDAGEPAGVSPDWLWTRLMRWCKRRGFAPASYDDLFEIVGEARIVCGRRRSSHDDHP